ncbi:MAG: DUF4810 domain-containing protein [Bacteroides sp.]|jgi:hypothetical protein|nr:DUF4810 domain-containing protein [Bacteroides sp.]
MRRFIILLVGLLLFACMPLRTGSNYQGVHHKIPLYSMEGLGKTYANYLEKADGKAAAELTGAFQKIIQSQTGVLGRVPPGIYADYGVLMMGQGNEAAVRTLMENEMGLYPEARTYIRQLLKPIEE